MNKETTSPRKRGARAATVKTKKQVKPAAVEEKAAAKPKRAPRKKAKSKLGSRPAPGSKISVLIVDDHPVFRGGLRGLLELEESVQVVGEAQDGQQAVDIARDLNPQVVLMDINLPRMNGMQATREITAENSDIAVIILTAYHDDEQMLQAMRAGAYGYFPKEVAPSELLDAIRTVSLGKYVIDDDALVKPQVASWLINQFETMQQEDEQESEETFRALSSREMEILKLITRGLSNKEIAKDLGISRQTVKNHMTSILRKLAVNDRTQAAVYALRRGWIRLQDTE
jgi:RNA polymerase sigma factor (sigma-70 family)